MELIDEKIIKRASRAIQCLPLNCNFYLDAKDYGLKAKEVFESKQRYSTDIQNWFNNVESVEETLQWLIIIGVLRREGDGQGLTSKIRLTPLGRKMIQNDSSIANSPALFIEKVKNWLTRNLLIH